MSKTPAGPSEDTIERIEKLLHGIVSALTERHEFIEMSAVPIFEDGIRFVIRVHRAEHGKIIGKAGKHINAIRLICISAGLRRHMPVRVTLDEPLHGEAPAGDTPRKANFDTPKFEALLSDALSLTSSAFQLNALDVGQTTTYEIRATECHPEVKEAIGSVFSTIGRSYGKIFEFDFV